MEKNDFVIKSSIREPERYLVQAFSQNLNSNGISLDGNLKVISAFDINVPRKVFIQLIRQNFLILLIILTLEVLIYMQKC